METLPYDPLPNSIPFSNANSLLNYYLLLKSYIDKFISSWRGKSYEDDPEYYDFIKEQVMMDNVLSEQGSEAF